MTSREIVALSIASLSIVALGGCANELDWQAVSASRGLSTPRWLWRNEHELWAYGGGQVLRRVDGAWEETLLCGEDPEGTAREASSIAFDGEDVWVVCGDFGPQRMVRFRGTAGEPVTPPFDGRIALAPVGGGVVVVGETSLHAWRDGSWEPIAPIPVSSFGSIGTNGCAGRSESEIYCTISGAPVQHWGGSAWSETDVVGYGAPELRAGDVWLGAGRFVDGVYEDFAGATDRGTVAVTVVPPSTVIWAGGDTEHLYLWRADRGSGSLEFLGTAPAVESVSASGTSGGSNFVYAIDRDTFVMVNATTSLSGSATSMWEGRL